MHVRAGQQHAAKPSELHRYGVPERDVGGGKQAGWEGAGARVSGWGDMGGGRRGTERERARGKGVWRGARRRDREEWGEWVARVREGVLLSNPSTAGWPTAAASAAMAGWMAATPSPGIQRKRMRGDGLGLALWSYGPVHSGEAF